MKKLVFGIAVLGLAVSCKKIPAGGNHGVLQKDASIEHYSDIEQEVKSETPAAKPEVKAGNDSLSTLEAPAETIKAPAGTTEVKTEEKKEK
ncbi:MULTISPECIES: hypothetical protein [Amniculibacterium]|jgi:hypothetical protein|uniref:hypothetical protein n=1 Tax=Amniculibacterium TaxID=2715289 RepID=UPI000F59F597|nr:MULTISPECIES: hypothetical protein [Amniculibacterium]